jgi:hypothetical protein
MYKIAICGKGGVGKSVFSKFLIAAFKDNLKEFNGSKTAAFADPIKEIILKMFPNTDKKILYGKSELRSTIIPEAFFNGVPLTYRKLLQHLGTEVCQSYKKEIWLDTIFHKMNKAESFNTSLFIVNDCRFLHEFEFLKKNNFKFIKIIGRPSSLNKETQQHSSEKQQELISDNEFNFIVNNNKKLRDLKLEAFSITKSIIT